MTKEIALTFDDGPWGARTLWVHDELIKRQIPATFMIWGEHMADYPEIMKAAVENDLFTFGNHTYSHPHLTDLSEEEVLSEIKRTDDLFYLLTGMTFDFVRPPFGDCDAHTLSLINRPLICWSLDTMSWDHGDPAKCFEAIHNAKDGDIVLMHDFQEADVFALSSILDYLQEEALNSVLPIGKNYTDCEKTFQRDLITPNLSVNSPFTTVDINHKKGKFYGINLFSHNIISIDRRDESMDNSNGLTTGVSGSGKSMTAKNEIVTTLLKNPKDEVIVLSPDDEYNDLPEKLDGQLIKIAPNTKHHINILDLPKKEDLKDGDDPVGLKSSFLVSLFSSLFETVSEIQESIIDEVTIETYQKHEKPTLLEWYEVLETKTFNNEEALDLTQKIKMYITGSMDIFSKETNVDLNSRFIVYDISQLTTKFKPFGFMALEENIWQRVVKNNAKGITTWVYFDEIQVLLSGKSSEISREKFKDIWSRIRKYGGNPTGITQFIDTVLETPEGRSMFFNSEFLVLLKQKKFAIEIIKQHYNITEQQEQYLKTPKKGSGLIIAGNAIVPFENTIPSSTELYKIMQTD